MQKSNKKRQNVQLEIKVKLSPNSDIYYLASKLSSEYATNNSYVVYEEINNIALMDATSYSNTVMSNILKQKLSFGKKIKNLYFDTSEIAYVMYIHPFSLLMCEHEKFIPNIIDEIRKGFDEVFEKYRTDENQLDITELNYSMHFNFMPNEPLKHCNNVVVNFRKANTLQNCHKIFANCKKIKFIVNKHISGNVLGFMLLKNIDFYVQDYCDWFKIIFKNLEEQDLLDCQQQLITAGYKQYAKI